MPARRLPALAALVGGALVIAAVPLLVRWSEVGPTATAFWRLVFALPVLILLGARAGAPTRRPARADVVTLVVPGLCFAGDIGVWHWAIRLTSIANATLLANLAPVFVTLAAWLLLGERVGFAFAGGLVTALAGTAVLVDPRAAEGGRLAGDACGVVAAMFYGSYLLATRRARLRFPTWTVMTWAAAAGAVPLLVATLATGEPLWPHTARGLGLLVVLGAVGHVGGQGLIAYALATLHAPLASVLLLLQPLGAAVLAAAVLGEPLGARQLVGGALVIAGIVLARRA